MNFYIPRLTRLDSDTDRITDFSVEQGDTIWLSSAVGPVSAWLEGDSAFISLGSAGNLADMIELVGIDAGELAQITDDFHVL